MTKQCKDLSNKQIDIIRVFIENYDKRNMPICFCDITRMLEVDDELPTRLEGSE